jgi:hypothetical protein
MWDELQIVAQNAHLMLNALAVLPARMNAAETHAHVPVAFLHSAQL